MAPERKEQGNNLKVRPFTLADLPTVVDISRRNFRGHSYRLAPKSVVNAYLQASSHESLLASLLEADTEAYVVGSSPAEVGGFFMLRHPNEQGVVELGGIQVDPDRQGQGIATAMLKVATTRGRALGAQRLSTQLGGAARGYLERQGWSGRTQLNSMEPVPAVVFSATKDVSERPKEIYQRPDVLIIASTSKRKNQLLHRAVGREIPVLSAESTESKGQNVVEVALDKARSVEASVPAGRNATIVATDVRTDIMVVHDGRIVFANRGKSNNPQDAMGNFAAMSEVADLTGRAVPYVVRRGTALVDPGSDRRPLASESDVSVWLKPDALRRLSTQAGFEAYRQSVLEVYSRDVMDNSASFAMQHFVANGMVAGMNGQLFSLIPNRDTFLRASDNIVYGTPDQVLLTRRLGL